MMLFVILVVTLCYGLLCDFILRWIIEMQNYESNYDVLYDYVMV